jgi:hypothetical protein
MEKKTIPIIEENAVKAYNNTTCSTVKKTLEDLFGKETFKPLNITDRVKTYEDACAVLGIDPQERLPFEDPGSKDNAAINAYAKLFIIAQALNQGWKPDWSNSNEYKWYPYFDMQAGAGLSYYDFVGWDSFSGVGSRLCFKSRELAEYAGKQFTDIYKAAYVF